MTLWKDYHRTEELLHINGSYFQKNSIWRADQMAKLAAPTLTAFTNSLLCNSGSVFTGGLTCSNSRRMAENKRYCIYVFGAPPFVCFVTDPFLCIFLLGPIDLLFQARRKNSYMIIYKNLSLKITQQKKKA